MKKKHANELISMHRLTPKSNQFMTLGKQVHTLSFVKIRQTVQPETC